MDRPCERPTRDHDRELISAVSQPVASIAVRDDRDRAQALVNRFVEAWNRHDAAAFAACFTTDAEFTNVRGHHEHGRDAIERFHAPAFAGRFRDSVQLASIRSVRTITDALMAVDVEWSMTGARTQEDEPRGERRGLLNWVVKHDGDDLILLMHNTEL